MGNRCGAPSARVRKNNYWLGITDPRFFELVGLFEKGIGPDLVSDMVGTILTEPLITFTQRVCTGLGVPMHHFVINGATYALPGYLPEKGEAERYVILVPEDVLSTMPVALDRSEVAIIAEHNREAREYLNATSERTASSY